MDRCVEQKGRFKIFKMLMPSIGMNHCYSLIFRFRVALLVENCRDLCGQKSDNQIANKTTLLHIYPKPYEKPKKKKYTLLLSRLCGSILSLLHLTPELSDVLSICRLKTRLVVFVSPSSAKLRNSINLQFLQKYSKSTNGLQK